MDHTLDDEGRLSVTGKTRGLYRYVDFTRMAEDLYRWTEETIRTEFRDELDFIVRYRKAREKLDNLVDMPDTARNRFVQFCLQNGGRLSKGKRTRYFSTLTDAEIKALEKVVRDDLMPRDGPRVK
ncbi:hypothetical protein [Corallococcus macrosporus]|uniref:Filamentation induced by cAMP protein Fic n=1 Tax=Corallococcus macrosporus DSM 14697 TaxID=1189310 RepID=A0A286NVV9_9BACT|nr:hypothetical protein [Corallococcus macrosporus]ATB51304.1 filamentation induced by cAMP protein Fic [Corallococcus macrosporus DSM 14697]